MKNKHLKKLYIICHQEMQVITVVQYHSKPSKILKIQNTNNTRCWWEWGMIGTLSLMVEMQNSILINAQVCTTLKQYVRVLDFIHGQPLNNVGLNCMGPLICRYLSMVYATCSLVGWTHGFGTTNTEETQRWKNCGYRAVTIKYICLFIESICTS